MVPGEQQEKLIGIVDYGMGNLKSVYNAFISLDAKVQLVDRSSDFKAVTHLVLPGVGSFAKAMENLEQRDLVRPILGFAEAGKPLLGICLGMQLLATTGFEPCEKKGLGLIEGEVVKMNFDGVRIPHVGWNALDLEVDHILFRGMRPQIDFYFVHSYYFRARHSKNVLAFSDYGAKFASAVYRENITGVQFHPEKSQKHGLRLLSNFYNS